MRVGVAETTLLSLRPSRLISIHYYGVVVVLWVLALLAFLDVWNAIPDWRIPGINVRLQSIGAGLLAFLGLLALFAAELKRLSVRYIVTDARIIRRDGVLRRRTNQMPFNKVERLELDQGVVQRIFRLGDIVLDTGEDTIVLESLGHVNLVQDELSRQVAAQARRG